MKIICNREKLLSAFQTVASVTPARSPKPILQNAKIEANNTSVTLMGTDLEIGIRYAVAGVEIELARMDDHLLILQGILRQAKKRRKFDFCILDTPPSLGVLMTSALSAADEVLVPLQCEWFGLEGLSKILHVIDQIRDSGVNPRLKIEGILMTMYDGRTNLSRKVVQEVKNYFPEWLYRSVIPRTIRLGEAPSHGKTIFEWDPHGTGSEAYDAAAKEFLRRHQVRSAPVAV